MRLLIATQNKGKQREIQNLLEDAPVTLVTPQDVGLADFKVEETGDSLGENAILKAKAFAEASGIYALADDTGLFIDALNGRPGIYAARYGDPTWDDGGRRKGLLQEMANIPKSQRTARFECVIALANPQTLACITVHGICPGQITLQERGNSGFGYDAVFLPDGYNQTFAEIADHDEKMKDRVSHRGDAARKIIPMLSEIRE
jgi:XTP/dITP diphosphohydrolase